MGKKRVPLSKGESTVASALWRLGSGTLGQIHEEVIKLEKMHYTTVQSYIRRLETKGYIKGKRDGRRKIYQPAIQPEKVYGQTIDQLVLKLFSGDSLPMLRHLILGRQMSPEALSELRQMIEEAEGDTESEEST